MINPNLLDTPLNYQPNDGAGDWFSQFAGASQPIDQPPTAAPSAAPPAGTPTGQPGAPGGVTMADFNQAWQNSPYPGTVDGLKQFMAAHPEYAQAGITLGGSKGDKVYGPGGAYWGDAVIGAGAGGLGKSALSGDTGGGSAGGGSISSLGSGYMLQPYTKDFALPTADEFYQMPGIDAALKAGQKAVQSGAAARGTLLTGGTQQALQNQAMGTIASLYPQYADLSLGVQDRNFGVFQRNQDGPFNKLTTIANLGKPAA